MKRFFFLLVFFFSATLFSTASAFATDKDSVYVDSLYSATVDNPQYAMGLYDNYYARILPGGELTLYFGFLSNWQVTFDAGATLNIYWRRQSMTDSEAVVMQFQQFDKDLHQLALTSNDYIIYKADHDTTPVLTKITVPGAGFNALHFTCTNGNGSKFADRFLLDGVTLIQRVTAGVAGSRTAASVLLENYPNPFLTSVGTTVRLSAPKAGNTEVVLTDLLGRGVSVIPAGEISAGPSELKITPPHSGIYIARLRINGEFVGAPLKITAE